jgi:tetratricopeptide (TPR) repeat protein
MSVRQITEEFIGRHDEIDIFTRWFTNPGVPQILYFYDALEELDKKGGIGKTRLLRKCVQLIAEQQKNFIPISVDFFNVEDRDSVVVAERIVQKLQERYPEWSAESFNKTLVEYTHAVSRKKTNMADIRERLGNALTADLLTLREQLIKTNTYLVVFFDTFELIEHNPITAVLRPYQTFPDNYYFDRILFVIAGRNPLNWSHQNWIGRQKDVNSVPISPFKDKEAIQYLTIKADLYDIRGVPQDKLQVLVERTERRPILLGLVADVLNQLEQKSLDRLITISKPDFEASLVEQINGFDSPIKWAIFFMAHIYHRFDETLLTMIMQKPALKTFLPEITYQQLLETLPTLSFIRRSGSSDDFVLHDEMHRLVNKYCWERQDTDGRIRRELSEVAIDYYTTKLAHIKDEEMRQSYIVEMLFHKLVTNQDEGFRYFEQHFTRAVDLSMRAFARSLLQEAQKFESRLSPEQLLSMKMAEARLLQEEENPGAALKIYQALEKDTDWAESHRADILYHKGKCYEQMSQFDDAITCFHTCLEIEQANKNKSRCAEIFGQLGYIYRRLGQYTQALGFYEESLALHKNLDNPQEYATMLNNISNVYRLQGKVEEALRLCKLGLRIRRDLFMRGEVSELYVGLSYSTMGHIYNDRGEGNAAERCYQEAFDIYNRVGFKQGIAATYNCLGQILLVNRDLSEARSYFEQAYRISFGIDQEARIESLNKLGKVDVLAGKREEAIEYFEQALELARQLRDSYHEAENLLDLAESLYYVGRPSLQVLKESKRISGNKGYYAILGHAEEIQGDLHYREGNYRNAFKHYKVACKYIALHNTVQFEKFLRKLVDRLLDMPRDLLPGAVDSLLEYWYDLKLDKTYPALLETCREVRRYMNFDY